jgi:tetratricopeptide (TPR) repeat protein
MNLRVKQFIHQSAFACVWLLVTQAFVIWMCPNVLQSPYEAYQLAMSLKERGEVERAHRTMLLAVAEEPHNPGYQEFMGYLDLQTHRPREAARRFRVALASPSERPQASLGLAEALLSLGDPEQARGLLASLALQRLTWEEERRLAQLMSRTGDCVQALAVLKPMVRKRPHDASLVLEAQALATAVADWEYVISLPTGVFANAAGPLVRQGEVHRAIALRALGRKEEAYALLQQHPGPDTLAARAELALELERFTDAADLYAQWLDQATSDQARTTRTRHLAYALARSGQTAAATRLYRALMATGDATPEDRIRFAWLLNQQRHYQEAWHVVQQLPRPPDNLVVLELQARTAFWAGKMAQAGDLLQQLLERKGN